MDGSIRILGAVSLGWWELDAGLRLLAAAAMGGLIGLEREHRGATAGFRTTILVAMGAALAMLVSLHFATVYGGPAPETTTIRIDPARVAYGVMGGVGFLGAGAIMRYGAGVRGLTTAASLWCTAAVGLACGFGMYAIAAFATAIVVFVLVGLSALDRRIPSRAHKMLSLSCEAPGRENVARLRRLLRDKHIEIQNEEVHHDRIQDTERVTFEVRLPAGLSASDLSGLIDAASGVSRFDIR